MNNNQEALNSVRKYDPIGDRDRALAETKTGMSAYRTRQTIMAIQYQPGVKVPGLLYESPGVKGEHGDVGPHAIVLIGTQYVLVVPGQFIEYDSQIRGFESRAIRVIDANLMITYEAL